MQPPSPCCACLEGREEPRVDGWSGMGKSGPETSRLTSPAAARCVRVGPSAVAARSCGDETLVRPASPPPPRGVTFMRVRVSSRVFVSARPRPRHPVRGLPAHHEPAREPSHGSMAVARMRRDTRLYAPPWRGYAGRGGPPMCRRYDRNSDLPGRPAASGSPGGRSTGRPAGPAAGAPRARVTLLCLFCV